MLTRREALIAVLVLLIGILVVIGTVLALPYLRG